jgi:hypothetical protein
MRRLGLALAAIALTGVIAYAQDDAPPLGDVARQARAQKQPKNPSKDLPKDPSQQAAKPAGASSAGTSKDNAQPRSSHVITNEELPAHESATRRETRVDGNQPQADATEDETPQEHGSVAQQWKEQIQAQKTTIANLQGQIDDLNKSIQYAPANCVENCRQWNEQQQRKQQQVDSLKTQLEELQHHLEDMQDNARKQGFGSNIYDP